MYQSTQDMYIFIKISDSECIGQVKLYSSSAKTLVTNHYNVNHIV